MNVRRGLLLCSLVALSAAYAPLVPAAGIGFEVDVAPPPARVEVVPAPRRGYEWAPGYWRWEDGRHVWVEGHWIEERPGYVWVPDRWASSGRRYHFEAGRWERGEHREHAREHEREHEHEHERD
jgi:hypothetical protein